MRRRTCRAVGLFLMVAAFFFFVTASGAVPKQTAPSDPEILVRVHDAETGAPVPNLTVNSISSVYGTVPLGRTDAHGEFRVRANRSPIALELGNALHSEPGKPPPGAGIYPAPGYSFWKTIDGKHAGNRIWDVKTYSKNAFAYVPATFRGVVYDSDGKPAGGATVRLLRDDIEQTVTADTEGRFAFRTTRLRPGEERGAIVRAQSGSESALMYPTPGQTWSGISVLLRPAKLSAVTGVAVDENGTPQAGVPVRYFEVFPRASAMVSVPARAGGVTDAEGRFRISGLTFEADYRFEFGGQTRDNPSSPWAKTTLPAENKVEHLYDARQALPFYLNPGQTRDLGQIVVLRMSRTIKGRMVPQSGLLPPRLLVVARGTHTNVLAFPDANGDFSLRFVPHEPLIITVYQSADGRTWRIGTSGDNFGYTSPALYRGNVTENETDVQIFFPEKKP